MSLSSKSVLQAFYRYLDEGSRRRPDSLSLKQQLELHTVEARILHELRTDWNGVDDTIGLLPVVEAHAFHWLLRDRHKDLLVSHWDTPLEGVAYIQADFKQHVTLPVGPSERGDWWYANARSQSMFMMDV